MATASDQVQVTARHVLQMNQAAVWSLHSTWAPMDHLVFPFVRTQVIFAYRPTSTGDDEIIPIGCLKQALSPLLDYYPHLTGRLRFDPDEKTPEIARLGSGAELLEAQCGIRLDDIASSSKSKRILMPSLPDSGNALLPPFNPTIEGVYRDPILAVKHNRFACGGVALGIRLHHIVCDAHGFSPTGPGSGRDISPIPLFVASESCPSA